jgi:hypothetical protein
MLAELVGALVMCGDLGNERSLIHLESIEGM